MKKFLVQMTDAIKSLIGFAKNPANSGVTASVPALMNGVMYAEAQVALIDELSATQAQDITGYASAKTAFKKVLALVSMTIIGPARAYYLVQGDTARSNQLKLTYSKLFKMKDGLVSGFCTELYNLISPMQSQLVTYGVTQDMLAAWQTAITNYRELISNPRVAIANRKVETMDLDAMVIALNEYCRVTLSAMVEVLRESNPSYYKNFHVNMKQILRGHRYTRLECFCTMGDSGSVVSNATVSVDGTELKAMTTAQGMCTLAPIPRSAKSISVAAPGYVPVNNMMVNFQAGETTKISVPMQMVVNMPNTIVNPEKAGLN